jgi:FAD:protein FMN transferase
MNKYISKSFPGLGTINTIQVPSCPDEKIIELASKRVLELHNRFSAFNAESDICRINAEAGKSFVPVHPDTLYLLSQAAQYSHLSEGAFDITVRPLVELWGIGIKPPAVPDKNEIKRVRKLIDYTDVLLDIKSGMVKLRRRGQAIDLGGIAKGFAADEVRRILTENGIHEAVINLGGTVIVMGPPKQVGVQHPNLPTGVPMGSVTLSDKTAVTSGLYEKFVIIEGKRYHHILSPLTGYPSEAGLKSITLIGDSALMLDAMTTAIFVMGIQKGLSLLTDNTIQSVIIDSDDNVFVSQGLKDTFILANCKHEVLQ